MEEGGEGVQRMKEVRVLAERGTHEIYEGKERRQRGGMGGTRENILCRGEKRGAAGTMMKPAV